MWRLDYVLTQVALGCLTTSKALSDYLFNLQISEYKNICLLDAFLNTPSLSVQLVQTTLYLMVTIYLFQLCVSHKLLH